MNLPEQCENIADIRTEIDALDIQIISLLGRRFEYGQAAAKFKTNTTSVKAPERFQSMLQQRRIWAENQGLDPDVIEKLYRDLVNYFMAEEMKHWQER